MTKNQFKSWVKKRVEKAAFSSYIKEKNMLSKIKGIEYSKLEAQKYLTDKRFSCEERKLLFALRAKCYNAKENFKGMNKHDMKCTLGCNTIENQEHIFTRCSKLENENIDMKEYSAIYENVDQQKEIIGVFKNIDNARTAAMSLLPGEAIARTRASLCTMQQT